MAECRLRSAGGPAGCRPAASWRPTIPDRPRRGVGWVSCRVGLFPAQQPKPGHPRQRGTVRRPRHPRQPPRRPATLSFRSAGSGARPQRTSPAESFRACTHSTAKGGRPQARSEQSRWLGRMARPGDRGFALSGADGLWLRCVMPEVSLSDGLGDSVTKIHRITHLVDPGDPRSRAGVTLSTHQPFRTPPHRSNRAQVARPPHLEYPHRLRPRTWLARAQGRGSARLVRPSTIFWVRTWSNRAQRCTVGSP